MATEADLRNWLVNEYGNRDFNQLCQALMWQACNRFGSAPVTYGSALDAYYASDIQGSGVGPSGSFLYFDIGTYGHVGFQMDGNHNLEGTTHLAEDWGWTNRGWADPYAYVAATGARMLGWSWNNGANTLPYAGGGGGGGGGVDYAWGLSSDCQLALQRAMSHEGRYSGPHDGEFGKKSVEGMQQWLKDLGYLGAGYVVDGIPGETYGRALQELARDEGEPPYSGPIDGFPGNNTSLSLIGWANNVIAGGNPDPGPDPGPPPTVPETPAGTWFGIDVGTSQAGMDFQAFADAGGESVIIKAGGGNAGDSPYVAPEYHNQLPAARAAGLAIGHYWFNGNKNGLTPTTSAQFFVDNMQLADGDVIALDVEAESSTGTAAYTPAEALEFVTEIDRLLPGTKVLIYMSASVVRSGEWDPVVAAGHPLWVAVYGANDGTIPAEQPDIDDWSDWAVWQYSSTAVVPGFGGSIDANIVRDDTWSRYGYTPHTPGPEPEPVPAELTELMEAYFTEVATVNEKYQELAQDLLEPPPAVRRR